MTHVRACVARATHVLPQVICEWAWLHVCMQWTGQCWQDNNREAPEWRGHRHDQPHIRIQHQDPAVQRVGCNLLPSLCVVCALKEGGFIKQPSFLTSYSLAAATGVISGHALRDPETAAPIKRGERNLLVSGIRECPAEWKSTPFLCNAFPQLQAQHMGCGWAEDAATVLAELL